MNSYFNTRRFGKYFLFDLKENIRNAGMFALAIVLSPVLLYLIDKVFVLVGWSPIHRGIKDTIYIIITILGAFCLPAQGYGHLTDKKRGTQWALVPASPLEKWLSMSVIVCFVYLLIISVPVIALCMDPQINMPNMFRLEISENMLTVNAGAMMILCIMATLVYFLLGALIFKKGKISKSWLIAFGAECVLTALTVLVIDRLDSALWFDRMMENMMNWSPENIFTFANIMMNVLGFGVLALLLAGTYFRIKSIKY